MVDKQPRVCYNKGTVKKKRGVNMRTPKDYMMTKPYPKVEELKGKALERRKKCLTKSVECDTIKKKMR